MLSGSVGGALASQAVELPAGDFNLTAGSIFVMRGENEEAAFRE
jgi:hypothetical protein